MKKKLEFITFKQFIYTINIRDCYKNRFGKEIDDSKIIRIYYKERHIELGWYDFTAKDSVYQTLSTFLKKEIMESYITDMYYDEDVEELTLHLDDNPKEDLLSLAN